MTFAAKMVRAAGRTSLPQGSGSRGQLRDENVTRGTVRDVQATSQGFSSGMLRTHQDKRRGWPLNMGPMRRRENDPQFKPELQEETLHL